MKFLTFYSTSMEPPSFHFHPNSIVFYANPLFTLIIQNKRFPPISDLNETLGGVESNLSLSQPLSVSSKYILVIRFRLERNDVMSMKEYKRNVLMQMNDFPTQTDLTVR